MVGGGTGGEAVVVGRHDGGQASGVLVVVGVVPAHDVQSRSSRSAVAELVSRDAPDAGVGKGVRGQIAAGVHPITERSACQTVCGAT